MKRIFFCFCFTLSVSIACTAQNIVIKAHDPHIHYMGRILMQDDAAQLSWPGSSLKLNFNGTEVKILLKDEHSNNYYNVIVDDKVVSVLHPDSVQKEYTLTSGLAAGNHSVELFKRTESEMGKTWFYEFVLDKSAKALTATATKKRKIEFFGNSITCGYAVEDTTGKDRGTGPYENNYISYAALTARHFDAEYYCTSKSGIGMMVSWFPVIMPEIYNRADATDFESVWDFSKYTPDVVVINLFQNDSWIIKMPENAQFKARFGTKPPAEEHIIKAYRDFVKSIRSKYPKAYIICALGDMDATKEGSPWPGYIIKAVKALNDKNIYTHFFPYKNTPGHPNVNEQKAMANDLIGFIDQNIRW